MPARLLSSGDRLSRLALGLATALTLVTLIGLLRDLHLGGNEWKQGDWLISNAAGWLRRGPMGTALLAIADALRLSPLVVVILVQAMLTLIVAGGLMAEMMRNRVTPARWLLYFSPASPLLFWGAYPQGSGRKELFAFAALALVVQIGHCRRWLWPLTGGALVLLALGMVGHEINILLAPVVVLGLWLALRGGGIGLAPRLAIAGAAFGAAALAAAFTLRFGRVAEAAPLCAPLLRRGLAEPFCSGAISWMSHDAAFGRHQVRQVLEILGTGDVLRGLAIQALIVLVALLPLIATIRASRSVWLLSGVLLGCLLLLAPIYPVATDWDRWLGVSVGAFLFLTLILSDHGLCRLAEAPAPRFWPVLAGLSLVWGLHASVGMDPFGLFRTLGTQAAFLAGLAAG